MKPRIIEITSPIRNLLPMILNPSSSSQVHIQAKVALVTAIIK
ncbi:MAG: hypothetical protein WAL79_10795 [Nitrososphaeraceae archaeon]